MQLANIIRRKRHRGITISRESYRGYKWVCQRRFIRYGLLNYRLLLQLDLVAELESVASWNLKSHLLRVCGKATTEVLLLLVGV